MLFPAGRLAGVKKSGWPKVSRSCLSCEYVRKNTAFELTSASEMLVGHYSAAVRSKANVERHRDVIRERRIEDVDGGLLVSEEAVDLGWGEQPIGVEVVGDLDLHGVSLRSLIGTAARATRIAGFHKTVSHRALGM